MHFIFCGVLFFLNFHLFSRVVFHESRSGFRLIVVLYSLLFFKIYIYTCMDEIQLNQFDK